ncbi:MAG TPA: hypothetical protein VES64_06975 [Allosphingosinicella sp.]|nr:hypothetical protein [Allosphingosinicella sp.]
MVRRRYNTILGFSAALLVAAAGGVQLGQSAVAEINPIHFQGAPTPPRGIDPLSADPPADSFADAYDWEAGHAALAAACGGDCNARLPRHAAVYAYEAPAAVRPAAAPYWRDAQPAAEPAPWAPGETATPQLSVERFMDYPVEQAPAEAPDGKISSGDEESDEGWSDPDPGRHLP